MTPSGRIFVKFDTSEFFENVSRKFWRLRRSRGSVLAFGTQVRGFAAVGVLGRKKILSTPSFGGEVKPSVPCHSFTTCKRSLNVTWKSAFRQNSRTFLAHSSTFRRWVLSRGDTHGDAWWRKLKSLTRLKIIIITKMNAVYICEKESVGLL